MPRFLDQDFPEMRRDPQSLGGWPGVVVPSWQVMKMPDDMTFESAAALPTVVLTALHAVNLVAWPMNLRYLRIMINLSSIIGYYRIL